jgi:hypothetical protein
MKKACAVKVWCPDDSDEDDASAVKEAMEASDAAAMHAERRFYADPGAKLPDGLVVNVRDADGDLRVFEIEAETVLHCIARERQ